MATIDLQLPSGEWVDYDVPDDWSDDQIQASIKKNFPQQKTLFQQAAEAPGEVANIIKDLGPSAIEIGKTVATHPIQSFEDLAAGLLKGARGQFDMVIPKDKQPTQGFLGEVFQPSEFSKSVYARPEKGHQALQSIGSYIPAMFGSAPMQVLKSMLLARGMGENPFTAGALFGAPKAVEKGIGKAGQFIENPSLPDFSPSGIVSRMARGNLPIEEIQANARAAEGTNTPLGRILEEPKLTGAFENMTLKTPLSKGGDILNELKGQIEERAENLLQKLEPSDVSGDLNDLTQSLLQEAYKKQRDIKNNLYSERNAIADKEGHILKLPETEKTAKGISKSIEDSAFYKEDPAFRNQFNKIMGIKEAASEKFLQSEILDQYGKPINTDSFAMNTVRPSLTEAQITAGDWYTKGEKLARSSDPKTQVLGNHLLKMSKALREDISKSIEGGSKELKDAHEAANKMYAESFSPFKDDAVWDKLFKENPEKIIREIIKPGKKADQARTIEKITNLLPENQKNILGYAYLKDAIDKHGNVSPKELAKLIDSLGKRQFEALFPDPKVRENLLDFGRLRGMNSKALDVLYNAETGVKAIPWIYFMEFMKNPKGALAMSLASRVSNKWLTDPKVRATVIDKIMEKKKTPEPTTSGALSKYFVPALRAGQSQKSED